MRRLFLSISILLGAACTPGSGEYGPCGSTADCQVQLYCTNGTVIVTDGGENSYIDGGVCRRQCSTGTGSADCFNGEVCGPLGGIGYCSSDGGY